MPQTFRNGRRFDPIRLVSGTSGDECLAEIGSVICFRWCSCSTLLATAQTRLGRNICARHPLLLLGASKPQGRVLSGGDAEDPDSLPMKATAKAVLARLSPIAAASAGGRSVLVEEFWVPDSHERADLVAVATELWAFEIKSPRDSLARLPRQAAAFSRLFDRCSAVLATRHLQPGMQLIPPWWGVIDAGEEGDDPLEWIRPPAANTEVDLELLVKLLWKDEALAVAVKLGIKTPERISRHALWRRLLREAEPRSLMRCVRAAVASRDSSQARIPTRRWAIA